MENKNENENNLDLMEYPLTYCRFCKEVQPVTLKKEGEYAFVVCDECKVVIINFRKNV